MRTILIALMLTVATAAAGQEVPETAAEHGLRASFNFPGCPNPIGQEGQPGSSFPGADFRYLQWHGTLNEQTGRVPLEWNPDGDPSGAAGRRVRTAGKGR